MFGVHRDWIKDAKDNQTTFLFDEWDRIKSITDCMENEYVYDYDNYNQTKTTYFLPENEPSENHYVETYDQWGRVVSRKGYPDGINEPKIIEEKYSYDLVGNLVKLTDARNKDTYFYYDVLNNLEKVKNALLEEVDYYYNEHVNFLTTSQYEEKTTYTNKKAYDERGLLEKQQEPDIQINPIL